MLQLKTGHIIIIIDLRHQEHKLLIAGRQLTHAWQIG